MINIFEKIRRGENRKTKCHMFLVKAAKDCKRDSREQVLDRARRSCGKHRKSTTLWKWCSHDWWRARGWGVPRGTPRERGARRIEPGADVEPCGKPASYA